MAIQRRSGLAAAEGTDLLWKEYFREPLLWADNRTTKTTLRSPDFTHTVTYVPLWVDGWKNPSWVLDELRRRTILQEKQGQFKERKNKEVKYEHINEVLTSINVLKACTKSKDICTGSKVHADIVKRSLLEKSPYLASTLINMYAKCGMIFKAQEVFENLLVHDTVSWNALIAGYVLQEKYGEAINCFELMQIEGLSRDGVTFISILKACGGKLDIVKGKQIHDEIANRGLLETDIVLGTSLVDMYAKCGLLAKAHNVLEGLPIRNEVSWNVLISGYVQQGQDHAALECLERMQNEGINPNEVSFLCTLKACGSMKAIDKGKQIHDEIVSRGLLEKHIVLGTALVDMYAKCGAVIKAQEVLEDLPIRNAVSWNALIAGYADHGQHYEALKCFDRMQSEGLSPNAVTFICILKACGSTYAIDKGRKIHDEIMRKGFLAKDIVLGTALVDMYAKCGLIEKAQEVLEGLPSRNVVAWSTLIMGYARGGEAHEALRCYNKMQNEGFFPDAATFICVLKACGITQAIDLGNRAHCEIVRKGLLGEDIMLCTALVDMYAKCKLLAKAQEVLNELPIQNVASWNALIAGYAQQGQGQEALTCFEQMQNEGLAPDEVTFVCLLNACGKTRDIDKGKQIHDEIASRGLLEKDIALGNGLVDMYAKCGMLEKAQQMLEELPVQNVVSWSALIAGYAQEGLLHKALSCFNQMRSAGFSPDVITLICILKACGSARSIEKGKQIHEEIMHIGLLEKDVVLGTALVDMYAKCGMLRKAKKVLEELPVRDIVSWNALIAGFVEQGQGHAALHCFERMQEEGLFPDSVTFISILKACGSAEAIEKGKLIHEEIQSRGLMDWDVVLGTALVDMYVKCGVIAKAQEVLEELLVRDLVSWNSLIGGYTELGQGHEALNCFEQMQSEGLTPDGVTFTHILRACSCIVAIEKGKQIHDEIVNRGLLSKNIALGTALVDMYAKCGMLVKAEKVLKELPIRGVITWNALITGHVQLELGHAALKCVEQMQAEGLSPNAVTFICILKACGSIGAIGKGKQIHEEIVSKGILDECFELSNALVDMYAKCGVLAKAQEVLDELDIRVVISWNALIAGYAQQGKVHEALCCFEAMQIEGLSPDEVTVLCVMNACSHSGLSDEAQIFFGDMSRKYDITPRVEHHTCMVMVLGCSGHFDKAISVIKAMPSSDYPAVWLTLLASCKKWGNIRLGLLAFDQAVQADDNAAAYVLMGSILGAAGMHQDADKVEACRLKYACCKEGEILCGSMEEGKNIYEHF